MFMLDGLYIKWIHTSVSYRNDHTKPHHIQNYKMTMFGSSFALLHLLLLLSLCHQSSVVGNNNETDRLALLEFKSRITYDPFGAMASWNNSIHFCHWYGVTCAHRHQKVMVLDLRSQRLAGSISPHVGNLSFLRNLVLQNNSFTGQIPRELGRLHRLQILSLANNSLVEGIPVNLSSCLNLVNISLSRNFLSGTIPAEIGFLMNLKELSLDHNNLTGNIPSSLGNLSSLHKLYVPYNSLRGRIPCTLGQLKNLTFLGLSNNGFEGTIPSSVFNLSSMESFGVYQNRLHGNLPIELGILFPNLYYFGISDNLFTGIIPPSLSNATNLQLIQLDSNKLHGQVPNLDNLRNLVRLVVYGNNLGSGREGAFEELDLSFNNFSGEVPSGGIFKNASAVSVEGNSMLCGATPILHLPICTSRKRKNMGMTLKLKIIIGIICSVLALFLVSVSLMVWMSKKKSKTNVPSSSENSLLQVSYQTLFRATEGFSSTNLIGVGSFGSLYKGVLDPHGIVAVKVFHLQQRGASKSFMAECDALRNLRHRNLLKVITACSSIDSCGDDFKAIVYEFMVNGNLDQWLHPGSDDTHDPTKKLNLLQRLCIAIDIACALDYLHCQYGQAPIVHCDLKPTNILLNDEMIAQVGDFGLMKFLSESTSNFSTNQTSTTGLRGTIGYAAPEYGTGSEVSTYGDMYSYGILLLEMFTARRPTDDMFNNDANLRNYVKTALPDHVAGIADPILVQEAQDNVGGSEGYQKVMESLVLIFGIGIACSKKSPRKRMNISDALKELIIMKDKQVLSQKEIKRDHQNLWVCNESIAVHHRPLLFDREHD